MMHSSTSTPRHSRCSRTRSSVETSTMLPCTGWKNTGMPVFLCTTMMRRTSLLTLPLCTFLQVSGKCTLFGSPLLSTRIPPSRPNFSCTNAIQALWNASWRSASPSATRKSLTLWLLTEAPGYMSCATLPSSQVSASQLAIEDSM